jgi:hypothetical protein
MICSSLNLDRFIVRLLQNGLYPNLEEFQGLRSPAMSKKTQKRLRASPRLVSISIQETRPKTARENRVRMRRLSAIVAAVDQRWHKVDAIVLPGGYFRSSVNIGDADDALRVRMMDRAGLVTPISELAESAANSPGLIICAGIDGPDYPNGDGGDQLCVAWASSGIVGLARKIFPLAGDESDYLLCRDSDYQSSLRFVELNSGHTALLCACYDVFGVAAVTGRAIAQIRAIKRIGTLRDELTRGQPGFRERLHQNIEQFRRLIETKAPTVAFAAIHEFAKQSTSFWQRHGIATCSAALGGGKVVGAAHFLSGLPRSPTASPLAAHSVFKDHLDQATHREAHLWAPIDYFEQDGMLARLYK